MAAELARALVPKFLDWFAFHHLDGEGRPRVVAWEAGPGVRSDPHVGRGDGGHVTVDEALRSRRPVLAWGDTLTTEQYQPARDLGLTSVVVVPVMVRSLAIGAMTFGTTGHRRGIRPGDVDTAQDLAARVAVAIERVLLGAETKASALRASRHAAQLKRLTDSAFAVNAALAAPALAGVVAEQAARVLEAEAAWVDVSDPGGEEGVAGFNGPIGTYGSAVPDAHRATSLLTDANGAVLGSVSVARAGIPFSAEDQTILGSLAQMASVALANADLYGSVQESETRLRALYDASPVAIVEIAEWGLAVRWNRAAERLFGWPAYDPDLVGEISVPAPALELVSSALADGRPAAQDVSLGDERNALELELVAVPLAMPGNEPDGPVRGVVLAAVDVTERKQVAEQLQQAQRMEAMGRMAGGIAHDFNNMLMVITGYADLLLRRPVDAEVRSEVEGMRNAATRAAEFTRKLLTISRRQIVQAQVVDVGEAVLSLRDVLDVMVGSNITLTVEVEGPPEVLIDPAQLEQVVLNLAINAKDAMPAGGSLGVRVSEADEDGRWCVVTVSDTGEGMDAATMAHCFDPFFTKKDRTKGTGLGLSTVYSVVTQAKGDIVVESRLGEGTVFTIKLPAADAADLGTEAERSALAEGTLRILVVDDEPEVRAIVADLLELEGHEVLVAKDGPSALAALEGQPPDVLLSDVMMPGMRGTELAELVLAKHPDVRVVLMSSHVDDELALARGPAGAIFLAKPFSSRALIDTIAAVRSGGAGRNARSAPDLTSDQS